MAARPIGWWIRQLDPMARRISQATLAAELARLEGMAAAELRQIFAARFGPPAPATASGRYLRHALAHELQLKAHGREAKRVARAYARIGAALAAGLDPEQALKGSATAAPIRISPGAKLLRDHMGETHEVMVLEGGFAWRGRRWRSLSAIAREITGQQRNGPAFFGLSKSAGNAGQGAGVTS
jgi:hypothetical protein